MKHLLLSITLPLFAIASYAQQQSKADYFSGQDIQKQLSNLTSKAESAGSSGATLGDYGSHKIQLSLRTKNGGAEIHAHYDDVFIVKQGHATLTTGGTIVDAKTGPDGETKGTGITGGQTQEISAGDVVNIPAGTPHQLKIPEGVLFSSIVIKVKE
jgi:mannose-6-phosphate isomerase-like protein (cupin superfamily)